MNSTVLTLIQELEELGRDHDAKEFEHSRKFINLERSTAELIRIKPMQLIRNLAVLM